MSDIGKLKLEVILSAVDRMTSPLKQAMASHARLAGTLKDSRAALKALNEQQAHIDGLEKMRHSAAAAYREARQARNEAGTALAAAQKQANDLATRLQQAQRRALPQQQQYEAEKQRIIELREAHMALQQAYKDQEAVLQRLQTHIGNNKDASDEDKQRLRLEKARLNSLRAERHNAGRKLYTARRENNELREDLKAVQDAGKALEKQFDAARRSAGKLKQAHAEQVATTHRLRESMKAAGREFADAAQGQAQLKQSIEHANRSLAAQQARLERLREIQNRQRGAQRRYETGLQQRDRLAGAGAATLAAGTAIGMPVLGMVQDYSRYEDAMLGIARQVNGARDAGGKLTPVYYQMGAAIRDMSQQIPMATTELAALVEGGARMGIQGQAELLAFARTAALASTAFDLPAAQISEDLGKIANTYKIPITHIAALGDTINWLDDNAQSKGADIIDVMQRIAGSTGSMSYKEAAALGSTFLSLGASSEVAATATKAMVTQLAIAEKQPRRFQQGLQALGLNARQVTADMARDSTAAILRVMEAMQKLPATRRTGVVVDLFGKEYGDDAAKLAANLGEYRKQLALVNDTKATGSMQREGDAKNDTLSARYQLAQNSLFNAKAGLGETLRQPATEVMDRIAAVLNRIGAWVAANPQLAATLMQVAAVAAVVAVVLGSLTLTVAGLLGPLLAARFAARLLGIRLGSLLPDTTTARAALQRLPAALTAVRHGASSTAGTLRNTLAKAWQAADPRQAASRTRDYVRALKERIPVASQAAWQATRQWGRDVGDSLRLKLLGARLAARQYTVQLWDTVKAQLAAQRSALGGKWQQARRYVASRGAAGMGKDVLGGGMQLGIRGVKGMGSALLGVGRILLFVSRLALMNPIGLVLAAAALLVVKYWEPIKAWFEGFWRGLKEGLAPLSGMVDQVLAALGPALEPLRPVWDWLVGAFKSAWDWVSKLLSPLDATKESLDAAGKSGEGFGKWLAGLIVIGANLTAKFVTIGADIMKGLAEGINTGIVWVRDAINGVGDKLPEWLRKKLDIHSPSRVFARIGGWSMAGLRVGLEQGASGPLASLQQLTGQLIDHAKGMALPGMPTVETGGMAKGLGLDLAGLLGKVSLASGLMGSIALQPAAAIPIDTRPPVAVPRQTPAPAAAPVYHIQIHAAPGMNETQLARMVAAELDRRERNAAARRRSRLEDSD